MKQPSPAVAAHPIRAIQASDFLAVTSVMDDWWGGRPVRHLLARLFFEHFHQTCFCIEAQGQVIAFLIGFVSPAQPDLAYIHFVGVHPDYRQYGYGRKLYQHFFATVRAQGVQRVQAITSPQNLLSIGFHQSMGFVILPGDAEVDGVAVHRDYAGPGQDRVLFERQGLPD